MMNSFDDVLGNLIARTEDNDAKRLLSAYDHSKTKPANASHLSSAAFTKTMLEATIDVLKKHTTEFYPHATALIRSKMVARTKIQIAEDICDVLYSITPTQCRSCKDIYISTSAENTDANITCLLCGRRSHKDCYNSYTIDNNVGVIFLCDACLTNTETALVLNAENAPQHHAAEQKTDTAPKTEDGNVDEDKVKWKKTMMILMKTEVVSPVVMKSVRSTKQTHARMVSLERDTLMVNHVRVSIH